jgi:Tol biopolymer transport system component
MVQIVREAGRRHSSEARARRQHARGASHPATEPVVSHAADAVRPAAGITRGLRAWLLLPLAAAACGDGSVIALGNQAPVPYRFGAPSVIAELSAPAKTDNPSLTADLLEIYFTSERSGPNAEVWRAQRSQRDSPFGPPRLVPEVNSPQIETSPVISADGLTLWLGSDRPQGQGDFDVWVSERSTRSAVWSTPVNLAVLNSPDKDIPRPIGQHDTVMPLGSDRVSRGYYRIYFATRPASAEPFGTPAPLPELVFPRESTVDGFLTDDGLTLFYCSGPAFGPADLYVASRRSTSEPFGEFVPLQDVNSPSDERDPFLSPDGTQFFFSSDRGGHYEIYTAEAHRQPVPIAP